jgi:photosystem II stability/assembly factor-like uncharacterized protein
MTWEAQTLPGMPLLVSGLWGFDHLHVFAVGWDVGPRIYRTADGGKMWEAAWQGSSRDEELFAIDGRSGEIFAVGPPSLIMRSADAGKTWDPVIGPDNGAPYDWKSVAVQEGGTTWIAGGRETASVFRSDDSGRSWIDRSFPAQNYSASIWAFGTDVFAGTAGGGTPGKIFHSSDGGKIWSLQYTNAPNLWIRGIWGADANDVYALADTPGLLHTTDGGKKWTIDVAPPPNSSFLSVWGSGPSDVYAGAVSNGPTYIYHKH